MVFKEVEQVETHLHYYLENFSAARQIVKE